MNIFNHHHVQTLVLAACFYTGWGLTAGAQGERQTTPSTLSDTIVTDEVIVTGVRKQVSTNSVSNHIDHRAITTAMGKTLASMLENTSGMSSIQTGTTVAKPVIHGMYGNRILIISHGARLTGQQWGADHAPELDKNGFSGVSVVKGSESVRYGSEALGGLIVMESKPLPYGDPHIHGSLTGLYGTNGRRYSVVAQAEGTMPRNRNWAWRVQVTTDDGGDRSTARYLLNNTGMRERDLSVGFGHRHGAWKAEAGYSVFHQKVGVMQSAQMGNEELLQERIRLGQPVETYPFSREIDYPHQIVVHHSAFAKAEWDAKNLGHWTWQTTFQADNRRENRIRRMNHSDIPTVSLRLYSLQNALGWRKIYGPWKSEAGVQQLATRNSNERGTGVVPIIPNYTEMALGAFGIQKYQHERWGAEAGVRLDGQHTEADGYDWTGKRYGGQRQFGNVTYTLGTHYTPSPRWRLTTNVGMAWRAPHVYELYSNGNELSSGMFVRGDSTLQSERSTKWVASADYHSRYLSVRVDAFLQWISNYIYDEPVGRNIVIVSGAYPVFQYKQTPAFFRGADLDIHISPLPELDYHVVTALLWANEQTTGRYLPYIPSTRVMQHLAWTPEAMGRWQPRVTLSHRYVARQRRFDPATDLVSFTPPAYNLFGFEASLTYRMANGQTLEAAIAGDNVLNKEYKEYTNRSRYYAHDMGRDLRCRLTWRF